MARSCKVAVIGAGAAGLLTARELVTHGHRVIVYEKADRIGGTWVYDPRVESDPLGLDPTREIVHGSLYRSLRTNLPREIMGFSDYPFRERANGDSRTFPGHEEVLAFLDDFARDFGLLELIRFGREVVRVFMVGGRRDEWTVVSQTWGSGLDIEEETFDAVVVCNGHFTEPRLAKIPGIDKWPGKQVHSHNYRVPEPFQDQIVVLVGGGPSAIDISRDISKVAKEVHLASRYKYQFPFLETNGIVIVDDNRVGPLYKHIFPPQLAPWLSFVGLPAKVVPFLTMELQSKWVAQVLSGRIMLPTEAEMMASINEFYVHLENRGMPKHHTHILHPEQFEYKNWLVAQLGLQPIDKRIPDMYFTALKSISSNFDVYRDEWNDTKWAQSS